MKQLGWLLATLGVLLGSAAQADVELVNSYVTGGPAETPWGSINCGLSDGVIEVDGPRTVAGDQASGLMDSSTVLSRSVSYNLNGNGDRESSAGCEVGLFYGHVYADVIDSDALDGEWGWAQATGTACFRTDSPELTLQWSYERSPYGVYPFVNSRQVIVYDWQTSTYLYHYFGATPDLLAAHTETLTLEPERLYVLYWTVAVEAGDGFGHAGEARLTVNLQDTVTPPAVPDIDVTPASHDFGEVTAGSSATAVVTLSNLGDADLTVDSLAFAPQIDSFSMTPPLTLPITIAPEGTHEITVRFAPATVGDFASVLQITSDDPDEPLVEVALTGVGSVDATEASEQMAETLTFFDASVASEDLVGEGAGKSGPKRLDTLRNMLVEAARLIDEGLYAEARMQLADAYRKCDGQSPPPDFVTGDAATELAAMIQDVIATLGG